MFFQFKFGLLLLPIESGRKTKTVRCESSKSKFIEIKLIEMNFMKHTHILVYH